VPKVPKRDKGRGLDLRRFDAVLCGDELVQLGFDRFVNGDRIGACSFHTSSV